ncbi:MAG: threonine synthase, partial [Oscillospiraceae bacterium]|nr:threonine synthase [Oscillospiraceae bacterium]
LAKTGKYTVRPALKKRINEEFSAAWCSDSEAASAIKYLYKELGYLCDTHTAVGFCCLQKYRSQTGDDTPAIVASTASPFKFCKDVMEAAGAQSKTEGIAQIAEMEEYFSMAAPAGLAGLKDAEVRFNWVIDKGDMQSVVDRMLKPRQI